MSVDDRTRVAVVGAGVVGLATTLALARLEGVEVRCFDGGPAMGARSAGDTRIFRLCHDDPAMVSDARRALRGWRAWENAHGRRLLGTEGLVVTGEGLERAARAMTEVGAPFEVTHDTRRLAAVTSRPVGPALFDPTAGVVRARETGVFLVGQVRDYLVPRAVTGVDVVGDEARVSTTDGDWRCQSVVLVAGAGTPRLARQVGITTGTRRHHHARFTFALADRAATPPCWLDGRERGQEGFATYSYCQPVTPGRYAIGGHLPDEWTRFERGAEAVAQHSRDVICSYVDSGLDGVDCRVVEEIRCDFDAGGGDGFHAARSGPVLAFWGDNLFKFAPLLGAELALAARTGGLPALAPSRSVPGAHLPGTTSRNQPAT